MAGSSMDEDLDYTFNPSATIYPARAIMLDTVNQGGCYLGTTGALCVGITPQQSDYAPGLVGNNSYPYILATPGDNSKVPVYGPMRRCLIDIDPSFGGTVAPGTLIMASTSTGGNLVGTGTPYVAASGTYYIIGIALSFATAGQSCNVKCIIFPLTNTSGSTGTPQTAVNTNITTVGAGTLTAAAVVGGVITRSGSTGAYTDTTATAAQIIAALPAGTIASQSWLLIIKNTVPYAETLSAGLGVTLSGETIVPGNSSGVFLVTYVSSSSVTIQGLYSAPLTISPGRVASTITTVGNGTLLAANLVGQIITRSGSTGAYTDTTDTAAAIIAALPNAVVGQAIIVTIRNTVPYAETISAGSGVTLSGNTVIPANSVMDFLLTYSGTGAVTMFGLAAEPLTSAPLLAQGTLTTVGAGTILAATIVPGFLLRTGSTSVFTDTTDTGTNIAAAYPNIAIGNSFLFTYQNSTYSVATLAGGVGVASAATFATVGPGAWAQFLFTYTAANTFTVTTVESGYNWLGLPPVAYNTGTTTTTFTAAQITGNGAGMAVYTSTAATPGSIATPTATAMFAAIQGAYVGLSWVFRVINDVVTNSLTVTADASVTLSGKTTYVATPFGSMDFLMTFTSATTATMKYIGGGQSTTA